MNSSRNRSLNSVITYQIISDPITTIKIPAAHYSILLDFHLQPKKTPKLKQALLQQLNVGSTSYSFSAWNKILSEWVGNIEKLFDFKLESLVETRYLKQDIELFFHQADIKRKNFPTDEEVSVILDHLEVVKDSPKLWATISLELETDKICKEGGFWRESFTKWTDVVRKKKYFTENFTAMTLEQNVNLSLSKIEARLLEFPQYKLDESLTFCAVEEVIQELICRVCLKNSEKLMNIFDVTEDDQSMTYASKINECSTIELIYNNDGLPELICIDCSNLLEKAYLFKTICESSNRHLRDPVQIIAEQEDEPMEYEDQEVQEEEYEVEIIQLPSPIKTSVKTPTKTIRSQRSSIKTPNSTKPTTPLKSPKKELKIELTSKQEAKNNGVEKPFVCDVCEKSFKAKIALDIHLRVHSNFRPYVCPTCGKSFKTCSAVNNHKLSHNLDKEFACDATDCPFRTNTVANLRIHKRTHTLEKNYKCDICSYKFRTSSNLSKHVRNIHNQQKLHKCESCEKEFFSKESLRKHEVTHSKVKNYHCVICHSAYGWYNGLQKHYKIHHPEKKAPTEKSFIVNITV